MRGPEVRLLSDRLRQHSSTSTRNTGSTGPGQTFRAGSAISLTQFRSAVPSEILDVITYSFVWNRTLRLHTHRTPDTAHSKIVCCAVASSEAMPATPRQERAGQASVSPSCHPLYPASSQAPSRSLPRMPIVWRPSCNITFPSSPLCGPGTRHAIPSALNLLPETGKTGSSVGNNLHRNHHSPHAQGALFAGVKASRIHAVLDQIRYRLPLPSQSIRYFEDGNATLRGTLSTFTGLSGHYQVGCGFGLRSKLLAGSPSSNHGPGMARPRIHHVQILRRIMRYGPLRRENVGARGFFRCTMLRRSTKHLKGETAATLSASQPEKWSWGY